MMSPNPFTLHALARLRQEELLEQATRARPGREARRRRAEPKPNRARRGLAAIRGAFAR
jgi:hypothetical protein